MKIAVCVNHVPDTAAKINISSDGKTINPEGVTFVVNPYDEFALEEALKTRETVEGEVVIISVGTDANKDSIRKALAMGADSAVLLKTDGVNDSVAVAKALAEEIKNQQAELVFMGRQSVDFDNSITGQLTAELLGYNCVSVVVDFKLEGDKITAEREIEGGKEVVETSLPAVITAQKGLNEPRYASLKGIMSAKRKTIEEKDAMIGESSTEILQMKKPAPKEPGKVIGSDSTVVPELVRLLREEAKVI
ncbi:MAG: electron transfer flavoprotein subunit beta/FixA family protein [Melioribacteraceae bacterium]|nr:electron transfer flavoprotein subunit beta/FixA family protein [Melioribacteraceae bacterium]